ncbi:MAG: porin, partial [Bacteroidales bacterium]|nr:porin [Bacteroidales bacterium]
MKRILALILSAVTLSVSAQTDESDNGVVSLAGREGFSIKSKKGDFVFKPYTLIQTAAK